MLNLVCDECGARFVLSSVNDSFMRLGRGDYDVAWFSCPACGKVQIVAIKDIEFYDLKAALDKEKIKMREAIDAGNVEKVDVLRRRIELKAARLSTHLELTMSKFHGTFTVHTSLNNESELYYLP